MITLSSIEIHFTTLYMADLGTQAEPLDTKASAEERGGMVCCLVLETIPVAAKNSFNVLMARIPGYIPTL
jgi:hypothetical protein